MSDDDAKLDLRLRKLRFRSWHRGMREADLLLGSFADSVLGSLTEAEIDQYELLLETPDTDLLPWLTGERPVPETARSALLDKVLAHSRAGTAKR